MYKKRKKSRRFDNGGINDDDFTRQDSTDVYDYRNLINFFDGLDPAKITEAADIISRGDTKYNKLWQKMLKIKELNEKMGDLGDFIPNRKAAGGMVDDDDFTRQDSVNVYNYRNAADILGADPHKARKFEALHVGGGDDETMDIIQKLRQLRTLSESMGDLGDFMPVKGETTKYENGGTVDNSNQPDSLTNYIKGHDNNNDMKKNKKKYGMGGVNGNPNDDNFSKSDSIAAYNYTKLLDSMNVDPVDAMEMNNPFGGGASSKLKFDRDMFRKIGPLRDADLPEGFFDTKKQGGMVNKSKSGNRDPFTNQYD